MAATNITASPASEWEDIRDFIILHFCANQRTDTEFWKYCSAMELPEIAAAQIDHFRNGGRFVTSATELFKKPSWFAVFMGQFIEPTAYHPLVDSRPDVDATAHFAATTNGSTEPSSSMPEHGDFIARNCRIAGRLAEWSGAPRRSVLRTILPRGAADAELRSVHRVPRSSTFGGPSAPDPSNLIRLTPA